MSQEIFTDSKGEKWKPYTGEAINRNGLLGNEYIFITKVGPNPFPLLKPWDVLIGGPFVRDETFFVVDPSFVIDTTGKKFPIRNPSDWADRVFRDGALIWQRVE